MYILKLLFLIQKQLERYERMKKKVVTYDNLLLTRTNECFVCPSVCTYNIKRILAKRIVYSYKEEYKYYKNTKNKRRRRFNSYDFFSFFNFCRIYENKTNAIRYRLSLYVYCMYIYMLCMQAILCVSENTEEEYPSGTSNPFFIFITF